MSGEKQFKFDFGGNSNADDGQQATFDFTGKEAALLPLMQKKLQELIGKSSGYLETLPVPVQNRVKGLKALHYQKEEIDQEFKKELAALKEKYRGKYDPIFTRRTHIITGTEEPTEEEIKVAEEKEAEKKKEEEGEETKEETKEEEKKEEKEEAKKEGESSEEKKEEDIKGIPDFWLEAMKHHDYFMDLITPKDEELLKHVTDIKCYPHGDVDGSFTLEFHFSENNFIKNDVLKKTYHLVEQPGTGDKLYDHVECTDIEWHAGKNLTRKTVKVQSGKGGKGRRGRRGAGGPKTVTVEKPCKSFFNFFQPDQAFEEDELDEEEMEGFLEEDYELGVTIKEQLLPNAVLWFTGEASVFGEGNELFGDSDEEEGEEEYNSDEDPDFPPPQEGEAAQQQQCAQQ